MSGLLVREAGSEVEPDGLELRRLKQRVDLRALIARGWDPEGRVFAPAADDPLFGLPLRADRLSACGRVAAGEGARFV